MTRPNDLGKICSGFPADLVLVDGNPLEDLSILTQPAKIAMVIMDGVIHKNLQDANPSDAAVHLSQNESPLTDKGVKEALNA